jgi:hypothetical protein
LPSFERRGVIIKIILAKIVTGLEGKCFIIYHLSFAKVALIAQRLNIADIITAALV